MARQSQLEAVASKWGSGVAGSGPEAGRRYFVEYATGRTSFDAPASVRTALRGERAERKAAKDEKLADEAKLYKAGFQAAERKERDEALSLAVREHVPQGKARQQRQAQAAIDRFLHSKAAPAEASNSQSELQTERARIAREMKGSRTQLLSDGPPVTLNAAPLQQVPSLAAASSLLEI